MNAYQDFSQPPPPPQSELQQHILDNSSIDNTNTDNDNLSSTVVPLKRTRAKRSCDFCRKRKSRCDADSTLPCSNCKAWGYTCEFQTVRKKRGPPSVYVDNLEKKCKKMESLLAALTKSSIEDLERNDYQYAGHSRPNSSPPIQTDSSSDDDEDSDSDAYQQTQDEVISKDYDSIKYTGQSSAGLRLFDDDVFQSHSSIPWPGKENIVLKLMSKDELMIVRTEKSLTTGRSDMFLDVGLSMHAPVHNNTLGSAPIDINSTRNLKKPARHQLDKMIGIYFSHIHSFLPIINKTKFLDQYHRSTAGPPSILMQAVFALTFRFAGQNLPNLVKDATKFGEIYFKKVMKRLRDSTRSRLCHVQSALLLTLYLDMDEGDVESIQWRTLGNAIRIAQDLGLHRSCTKWNLPRSEIETRHRVFYACYVMDRWIGARAGKPLTILDRDFDTDMPSPHEITDNDDTDDLGAPIYRSFIHLIKLSEILGRILKSLYAPKAKLANANAGLDDPTILSVFDRRLQAWKNTLEEPLQGEYLSDSEKDHLKVYFYTTVLLLRRPFTNLSTTTYPELQPIVAESETTCLEAAHQLSEIVQKRSTQVNDPTYYYLLCVPSCFVYALFQSSLVFLSNALKTRNMNDIEALHQSIHLLKTNSVGPAPRANEILNMLVAINNLQLVSSGKRKANNNDSNYISVKTLTSTNEISTYNNDNHRTNDVFEIKEEVPRVEYFPQRMMNTSIVGGITPGAQQLDLSMTSPFIQHQHQHQQPQSMHIQSQQHHQQPLHIRRQQPRQQPSNANLYIQNNSKFVHTPHQVSSHHRSFSMDQMYSLPQNVYTPNHNHTHHGRSISHDNLEAMTSSSMMIHPPVHVNSFSSLSNTNHINVHGVLNNNSYTSQLGNPQQQQQHVMNSFSTSLPQVPNMNVSNSTIPPPSLNWSDWDVYIGHQNEPQQTRSSSSPQKNLH